MRLLIILMIFGILLFGCTQGGTPPAPQTPTTQNPTVPAPSNPTNSAPSNTNPNAGGQTITIRIAGFAFTPAQITVKQGDTVVWVNDDSAPHTIKATGFESSTLSKGQSYQHRFTEAPGDYAYICGLHPSMKGKVIVTR